MDRYKGELTDFALVVPVIGSGRKKTTAPVRLVDRHVQERFKRVWRCLPVSGLTGQTAVSLAAGKVALIGFLDSMEASLDLHAAIGREIVLCGLSVGPRAAD